MTETTAALIERIDALLDEPLRGDGSPTLELIERMLTDGYAQALRLEAERWRIERRIGRVATELGNVDEAKAHELAGLSERLSTSTAELAELRKMLVSLRGRADAVRAPAPAGAPDHHSLRA